MAKEIEVICPCCNERIVVDPVSRRGWPVSEAAKRKEREEASKGDAFEEALKSVHESPDLAEDKFKRALSDEKDRGDRLDEAFRKAKDEAEKSKDEKPFNPLDWD